MSAQQTYAIDLGHYSARRRTHYLESKLARRDGRNLVRVLVSPIGNYLEEVFKACG